MYHNMLRDHDGTFKTINIAGQCLEANDLHLIAILEVAL